MAFEITKLLDQLFNYDYDEIRFCISMLSAVDRYNILSIMSENDIRLILKKLDTSKKKKWLLEVLESDDATEEQIKKSLNNLIRILEYCYLSGSKYRTYGIILSMFNYDELDHEYLELKNLTEKEKYLVRRHSLTFEIIKDLNDVSLQRVIRAIEDPIWIEALSSAPVNIIEKILNNVSIRKRQFIEEELKFYDDNAVVASKEAQEKVAIVIKKLLDSGEILMNDY